MRGSERGKPKKKEGEKKDRQRKRGGGGRGSLRMCAEFELEIGNRMSAQDKQTTEPLHV